MHQRALAALASPESGEPLAIGAVLREEGGELLEGALVDPRGQRTWPVRQGIPRFVDAEGYTANFGEQWNRYRRTQIDRWNGTTLSRDRLFSGTGWTPEELRGQRVLEVGCGAGRFTQVLLDAGAEVCAVDASRAVEACWRNNSPHPRLCVVQADLYAMPFRRGGFDKVLCYGVLQHTPEVKRAFMSLVPFLKPGGSLAVDVYHRLPGVSWINRWGAKRWWRPLTRRLPPATLARIVEWYVPKWLPIDTQLARVPGLGRWLVSIVPCWNYTGRWPLTPEQICEWAILDTFDALSARYDQPQTLDAVRGWCEEAGLSEIHVRFGGNGLLGNARRPREAVPAALAEAAGAVKESPSWR